MVFSMFFYGFSMFFSMFFYVFLCLSTGFLWFSTGNNFGFLWCLAWVFGDILQVEILLACLKRRKGQL